MNYGELKTYFLSVLNRRDITPTLVSTFISLGIQRAQRLLRVPSSEEIGIATVEDGFVSQPIPGDYLKLVSLSVNGSELTRTSLAKVQKLAPFQGCPRFFARNGPNWLIGPRPPEGAEIEVVYQANFSNLNADTDSNWLTDIAPDVIVYAALNEAAVHYTDPRKDEFEMRFLKAVADLNLQASDDELTNASVAPAYYLHDEEH